MKKFKYLTADGEECVAVSKLYASFPAEFRLATGDVVEIDIEIMPQLAAALLQAYNYHKKQHDL